MAADREPLMTVTEVATVLHLGRMTVNRMIHRRELRAVRIGRLWRIPASEVDRLATPEPIPAELETAAVTVAAAVAEQFGLATTANLPPAGTTIRIFKTRPWETAEQNDDNRPAASRGSRDTKKSAARG